MNGVGPNPMEVKDLIMRYQEVTRITQETRKHAEPLAKELKQLETKLAECLIHLQRRFVAITDDGPFITLVKKPQKGVLNEERKAEFYDKLLASIQAGNRPTSQQCIEEEKAFSTQFEIRQLGIAINKQTPRITRIQDLLDWLRNGNAGAASIDG
jgi:hypothetical protein